MFLNVFSYAGYISPAVSPPRAGAVLTEEPNVIVGVFSHLKFSISDNIPPEMQIAITKQIQRHGG